MADTAIVDAPSTPEPTAPPFDAPQSIAEHESQLQSLSDVDASPTRHRARGQFARADDVPVIATLTKELRALEQELGITQKDGESPRVYALRRQLEIAQQAKAAKATPKPDAVAAPAPARTSAVPVPDPPVSAAAFTDVEPKLEDFSSADDPYTALTRALARYDRRKEDYEAKQAAAVTRAKDADAAAAKDADERMRREMATYAERVTAFTKTTPDFVQRIKPVLDGAKLSDLAMAALIRDDNGPALVLYLAEHPDEFDALQFDTDGKPVTDAHVATVQRRLKTRMQAAVTGSAAPTPQIPTVPRPPNPVRTGPQTPGDTPPGDGHSLADHERAWSTSPRRRR